MFKNKPLLLGILLFCNPPAHADALQKVEINPYIGPLSLVDHLLDSSSTASLSFSYGRYDTEEKREWVFPVFWSFNNKDTDLMLEAGYRYYVAGGSPYPNGIYIGGFSRYFYSKAEVFDNSNRAFYQSANRLGLGLEAGLNFFFYKNYYWSINIKYGRYFAGDLDGNPAIDRYILPPYDSGDTIFDFTLLHVGMAFY